MPFMKAVIAVMTFCLAGYGILRFVDPRRLYDSWPERTFLSYVLGLGSLALIQFYLMLLGCRISDRVAWGMVILIWCPYLLRMLRRVVLSRCRGAATAMLRRRATAVRFSCGELVTGLFIAYLVAVMVIGCLITPKYTADSRATWGLKTKIIYREGTIFVPDFQDPYRYHSVPSYPLLFPLAESFFYRITGRFDEYLGKSIYAFLYVALTLFLYTAQKKYYALSRLHSLIGTAVMISVPSYFVVDCGSLPGLYLDFPLGCLFTLAVVYVLRTSQSSLRPSGVLAGLFLAFCLFAKNEGKVLFLMVFMILIAEIFVRRARFSTMILVPAVICGIPIVLVLPWFIVSAKFPVPFEIVVLQKNPLAVLAEQLPLLPYILELSFKQMFLNIKSWGFLWYLITLAICVPPRNGLIARAGIRSIPFLLLMPLVYYFIVINLVYLWVEAKHGMTFPLEIEGGFSFERLRMHMLPLLMLYCSLALNQLRRSSPPEAVHE